MKFVLCLAAACAFAFSARADLTLVQKVEGGGPITTMTIKVKGDKVRLEATPQVTTIIDSKTGDTVNLMNEQKIVMRVPAEKAKSLAQVGMSMAGVKADAAKPQLKATGKKEVVQGHQTEEYVIETPQYTATYAIAKNYPNAAEIMNHLKATTPEGWSGSVIGMPDFRDFPGLPLRTKVKMGDHELTSSIVSVSLEPINAAEFNVPADFKEMKLPEMLGGMAPPAKAAASPAPTKP